MLVFNCLNNSVGTVSTIIATLQHTSTDRGDRYKIAKLFCAYDVINNFLLAALPIPTD